MFIFFLFIIITIVSYLIIYDIGANKASKNTVERLYLSGKEQKDFIDDWVSQIKYETKIYSSLEEIQSMNKEKVSNRIDFIKSYRDIYQNIILVNKDKKIINGYVENEKLFLEQEYILKAFSGEFSISDIIKYGDNLYIDITDCVKKDEDILGIMCFRISRKDINKLIKKETLPEDTECYIVDKEGCFLTTLRGSENLIGKEKVDLDKVKLDIDYSNETPYKNYKNKLVYGMYYPLNINNWTLIIEKEASYDIQLKRMIVLICGITIFLQIITMLFVKRILIKDCIKND